MAIQVFKNKIGYEDVFADASQHNVRISDGSTRAVWGLGKYFALLDGSNAFTAFDLNGNAAIVGNIALTGQIVSTGGKYDLDNPNAYQNKLGGSVLTIGATALTIAGTTFTVSTTTAAFAGITASGSVVVASAGGSQALRTTTFVATGAATFSSTITATSATSAFSDVTASSSVVVAGASGAEALRTTTFRVTGAGVVESTLAVTGAVTLSATATGTAFVISGETGSQSMRTDTFKASGAATFASTVVFQGAVSFSGAGSITLPEVGASGVQIGGSGDDNTMSWDSGNSRLKVGGSLEVVGTLTAAAVSSSRAVESYSIYNTTASGATEDLDWGVGPTVVCDPNGAHCTYTSFSNMTAGMVIRVINSSSGYNVVIDNALILGPTGGKLTADHTLGPGDSVVIKCYKASGAAIIGSFDAT